MLSVGLRHLNRWGRRRYIRPAFQADPSLKPIFITRTSNRLKLLRNPACNKKPFISSYSRSESATITVLPGKTGLTWRGGIESSFSNQNGSSPYSKGQPPGDPFA